MFNIMFFFAFVTANACLCNYNYFGHLYSIRAVVPSVAWDFLFDKHINLTYLNYLTLPNPT